MKLKSIASLVEEHRLNMEIIVNPKVSYINLCLITLLYESSTVKYQKQTHYF